MNTIENNETIEFKTKKIYIIEVNGLSYGKIIRKTENYTEALKLYREIKDILKISQCEVKLSKAIIENEKDVISSSIIHKKIIGSEYNLENKLLELKNIIDEIMTMKKMYTVSHSESDKFLSAVYHIIEHSNSEELTEKEMRYIFRNMENKCAIRRASKDQIDYITLIEPNLNQILRNTNKAIELYKNKEYNSNTEKAKKKSEEKLIEYKEILQLQNISNK